MFCGWDHIRATCTLEILKESGISFFIFAYMDMLAVVIPPSILQDMMSQNLYRHSYLGSVARKFVNVVLEFFEEIIPFFLFIWWKQNGECVGIFERLITLNGTKQ